MDHLDCVVIGGGFAGLRAARDLHDAGRRVVLLEARDRLGGRTWTRPFGGDGPSVEVGGTWFTPGQDEVVRELDRYGVGTRTYPAPTRARWHTGGERRDGLPVLFEEIGHLERALVTIAGDAARAHAGTLGPIASQSCADYIAALAVPTATAEFLAAWWVMIGGTDPARGAIIDALQAIANHGGVTGLITALRFAPVEGWSELARRMGADLDVRVGFEVARVAAAGDAVRVDGADGTALTAARVVVAVPVNVLPHLAFDPPLPAATAEAAGTNAGRSVKAWFHARGVPAGSLAAGRGAGVSWLYADRALDDGSVLALGFGWERPGLDPAAALHAFWPEAELLASDWHDWNADPFSRGTWATATVGKADLLVHDRFPPHGRIAFAGADIAPHEAGWIEGALLSGAAAARWDVGSSPEMEGARP
jgi:monoamine oxidase